MWIKLKFIFSMNTNYWDPKIGRQMKSTILDSREPRTNLLNMFVKNYPSDIKT